jgi:predicted nucleic acid-binding protein
VLRSSYRYTRERVLNALRAFAGLPNVVVESSSSMSKAVDWAEQGMDLADALHLAQAQSCDAFVTFDQHLVEMARTLGPMPVRAP